MDLALKEGGGSYATGAAGGYLLGSSGRMTQASSSAVGGQRDSGAQGTAHEQWEQMLLRKQATRRAMSVKLLTCAREQGMAE